MKQKIILIIFFIFKYTVNYKVNYSIIILCALNCWENFIHFNSSTKAKHRRSCRRSLLCLQLLYLQVMLQVNKGLTKMQEKENENIGLEN